MEVAFIHIYNKTTRVGALIYPNYYDKTFPSANKMILLWLYNQQSFDILSMIFHHQNSWHYGRPFSSYISKTKNSTDLTSIWFHCSSGVSSSTILYIRDNGRFSNYCRCLCYWFSLGGRSRSGSARGGSSSFVKSSYTLIRGFLPICSSTEYLSCSSWLCKVCFRFTPLPHTVATFNRNSKTHNSLVWHGVEKRVKHYVMLCCTCYATESQCIKHTVCNQSVSHQLAAQ